MQRIIQALDKVDIQQLSLGDRQGHTGYIDFLSPSDLSHDVMTGKDLHGREFLSIKLIVEFFNEDLNRQVKRQAVVTLFSRYVNRDLVAYGTNFHPHTLFTGNLQSELDFELVIDRLKALQDGEVIKDIIYDKAFYTDPELIEFNDVNKFGNGKISMYLPCRLKRKQCVAKNYENYLYKNLISVISGYI